MDGQAQLSMYHLLAAPGYDQMQWGNPFLDNTKAAIDSTNPMIGPPNPTTNSMATAEGTGGQQQSPSSIFCPQPVKYEPVNPYADTGGYSITPLGITAGSSTDHQHHLYGVPAPTAGGSNHPPDPQQLSTLNFFAGQTGGGTYPATPAALMGPLLGAGDTGGNDSEQLKQQKELIYAHPLFPMLTVLFQKCELATCTPREPAKEGDQIDMLNVCSAASFSQDLEEFARTVQMNKPYYVPNPELDSLMVNAIQVLRYHLLELEKVHELCDNFCAKYVNKIKERTQMDIIAGEQPPPSAPIDQQQQSSSSTPSRNQQQGMGGGGALHSPAATSSSLEQQMQNYGTPVPHPQYGQEHHISQPHTEQLPGSICPQQLGFLDLSAAAAASSAMSNAMMLEQQHAAMQQYYAQQQQQQMGLNGGLDQMKQEMSGSVVGNAKSAKRAKKTNNHQQAVTHQKQQQQPPQENHPSPDTTARTDSAGGSRSSTAAATITGEEQQQQATTTTSSATTNCTPGTQQQQTPQHQQLQNNNSLDALDETGGDDGLSFGDSMSEERDSASPESDQKKGEKGAHSKKVPKVFSKDAINKFRAWLFNNITHPYPAEEQKKQLATETGLTITQVNNWFINARRRIVQPMIDSNNRAGRPLSVFKNRRRKSSGGNGGTPSPTAADCRSPELANGNAANGGNNTGVVGSASPEESSAAANNSLNISGESNSSADGAGQGGGSIAPHVDSSLLNFSTDSTTMATAVSNPYQAAAAVAAAAVSNPYANFGGAFPFAGMGGMSAAAAMMPYGLNSMPGAGWSTMDLGGHAAHRSGLDG